ncbi:centrosomal protein of 89 kDa [Gastrophryne carolinensis]
MSFPFRRRQDNQFKHIAHGLIPAATVAPRSAVPRTPPPRSPNPSPERPRSALAAAILMTSLTGRTVAIPHPHPCHRPCSENDGSYADEASSQIQPYAMAEELGVAHHWEAYAARKNLHSPIVPFESDDDDDAIEEQMSDIEKRDQQVFAKQSVTDVSEDTNRHPPETSQQSGRQMLATNNVCTFQNQGLASQVVELKQQIKAMRLKMKGLRNEKKELEEAWRTAHMGGEAAELASLQQQSQELVDENDSLKMTIHRLNVELSRYQTKFRPLAKEETIKISSLPPKGPPPPWLLDMKYLSPLLLAYEDRLKEKDHLIGSIEEEMKSFKVRVKEVIEENEKLHHVLEQDRPVTRKEWELLQSQNKLLLEENRVLVETLEVQEGKSRESHTKHLQEVSQLTKQLMSLEAANRSQEEELLQCQKQQELLRSKYSELKESTDGKVAAEEHVAIVNELKSKLQQQRSTSDKEMQDLHEKMTALQTQKKAILLQKNDLLADNKILEGELEAVQKSNRKMKKRIIQLRQQLEDAMEKEVMAHQYLANLITVAENISGERDQLIHVAKGLEAEKHGVLSKMMEGSVRLGRLEEMVKVYKKKASSTVQGITHKLTEQEQDFSGKAARYQREMKHLQWLLRDRQDTLNEVLQQKRQVEGELEVIWESTSNENKQLKALLHESMKRPSTGNSPRVFQCDSVIGCSFNYCDVNSFSHREKPTN